MIIMPPTNLFNLSLYCAAKFPMHSLPRFIASASKQPLSATHSHDDGREGEGEREGEREGVRVVEWGLDMPWSVMVIFVDKWR
jgi:hypothetical protein